MSSQSNDAMVAPEGVYRLTASYVLPPQPAFMTPITNLSSLQPMSNNPAASSSATTGNNANANNTLEQQQATGTTGTGQSSQNAQQVNGLSPNGHSATSTNAKGVEAGDLHAAAVSAVTASMQNASSSHGTAPKTALSHISMRAPSAWAHAPILPPSRISVASVRHITQTSTTSSSSMPSLGRRDRQQASLASTLTPFQQQQQADESGTSTSDQGENMHDSTFGAPSASSQRHPRSHWAGPVIEGSLASQGIDGTASHVTGGLGGLPGMAALQHLAHLDNSATAASTSAAAASNATNTATGVAVGMVNVNSNNNSTGNAKSLPRPKNNIRQTSSSFVQRLQAHQDFAKLLAARSDGMTIERHAFISRGRMLFWLGETAVGWIKEPIARISFSTPITTHDVNQQTRSPSRLDIIIGFTTSDVVWLEAVSMRYSRLNKGGCINQAPITSARWVPGSESLVLTSHSDGTCTLLDITRDDSAPGSWSPISGMTVREPSLDKGEEQTRQEEEQLEVLMHHGEASHDGSEAEAAGLSSSMSSSLNITEAIQAWEPRLGILITKPLELADATAGNGSSLDASRKTWSKLNPIAHWRIDRFASIKDFAFSPDHQKLAIVATDGTLRLLNLVTESLEGTFQSYYGAMNRVVWSPDAKFLLTAGCDDLISIWTSDGRLLSRCIGHSSFVTGLAFDPWKWRLEDRTYRFVSVGEDGRVFLWDFSSAALHRPRLPHSSTNPARRVNTGSGERTASPWQDSTITSSGGKRSSTGATSTTHKRLGATAVDENEARDSQQGRPLFRPAPARGEVAELQPVASFCLGPVVNGSASDVIVPFAEPVSGASGEMHSVTEGTSSKNNPGPAMTALNVLTGTAHAANALGGGSASMGAQGAGSAANGGTSASLTSASATTAAANATTTLGAGTTAQGAQPNAQAANEPGAPNDLLVDVRCRPDGIVVLHKSGALRYFSRPLSATGVQPSRMPASAKG